MRLTVFGASGKVGSLVVEEALWRGYDVVAFTHSHQLTAPSGKLTIVKGDIYNVDDVSKALNGSDVVISCLGSWGTRRRNVLTAAMQNIIPAMAEHKIDRIVTLTGSGADAPEQEEGLAHKLVMLLSRPFPAYKVFRDGEEHMQLLAGSELNWTTLRSPVMTNAGAARYRLNPNTGGLETVSRKAVAAALLDLLNSADYRRQAPVIHRA